MLVDAGFADVRVVEKAESREFIKDWLPGSGAEDFVVSANVTATKPNEPFVGERVANATSGGGGDETCCGQAQKTEPATVSSDASLAASAAAAFGKASGASASAAARVGAAAAALVVALGGAIKSVGEHHARHTDEASSAEESCAPEPVKEDEAGC